MRARDLPTGWPRGLPLPAGWSAPLLSSVAHRESGHTPDKENPSYWDGDIKWLSLTDCDRLNRVYVKETTRTITQEGIDNSSARLLPPGVVVLSCDAGVGQSAITTCAMAVSQHFLAWQCAEKLDPHFLYYWFQRIRPELERIAAGSTIKTIGLWYFDKLRIPLPPIELQRKTSSALLALDKLSDLLGQQLSAKSLLMRGLLQRMLTGKSRFPEYVQSKSHQAAEFGAVPGDWRVVQIGDVAEEVSERGAANGEVVYSCTKHDGLVPSLEYFGKQVFSRNLDAYKRMRVGDFAYATNHIEEGSIGLLRQGQRPGLVSPMYTVFRADGNVNPAFLFALLKTESFRRVFETRMTASVDRRGSLRWKEFSRIKVGLPSLNEQNRIVGVLELLNLEIEQLKRLDVLVGLQKRGVMNQLVSGGITVSA